MSERLNEPDPALAAQIVEQNIAMHEATAELYDLSHPELRHAFERVLMRRDLNTIARLLAGVERPQAVDVGAGTGRLTLQFAARGWDCLAVDNSPAMLGVLQRRYARLAEPKGRVETMVCGADDFRCELVSGHPIHLVGFSSVLHHLPHYLTVVAHFAALLAPGGVMYITQEPLPTAGAHKTLGGRVVKALDQLLRAPLQVRRALAKRRLRVVAPADTSLVDYYDHAGLDTEALRTVLAEHGLEVVRKERYKDRKTAVIGWLDSRVFHTAGWRFRVVAQKRPE